MHELTEEFAAVKRTSTFWIMFLAFTLSTLFVAGTAQHMAPMLRELGANPTSAARYMSLLGIGTVCLRLIAGWLSDYVPAPRLMAFSCVVGMAGDAEARRHPLRALVCVHRGLDLWW